MKENTKRAIGTTCILGAVAVIKASSLLTPVQVYGAEVTVKPCPEMGLDQVTYCWASQVADFKDTDPAIKEGTPTGSKDGNSLEDWNDVA
jgi:hypothetical protein